MKNVYEIREEKNLYYILSEKVNEGVFPVEKLADVVIIINLYYPEDFKFYSAYIENIPKAIDVYIVTANTELYVFAEEYINKSGKGNIKVIRKNNRGRDISALLVCCREIVLNYEYVCFTHDKKAKNEWMTEDTEFWVENLWKNTLASKSYINNVLHLLSSEENVGLLVPPEPMGNHISAWYSLRTEKNSWGTNFENTVELSRRLALNCDMKKVFPPITLGTAFWCKTKALRKLFEKEWAYEDFQDEPLPNDGTLSHAVERIFAYVAQDAGYETGTVMASSYAEKKINRLQKGMGKTFEAVFKFFQVSSIAGIENFAQMMERTSEFCRENAHVYLYGAGEIANLCYKMLGLLHVIPEGVVVTKKESEADSFNGFQIKELKDIDDIETSAFIVAAGRKHKDEMAEMLESMNCKNYICYSFD